jgi:hypothetical protein
MDIFTGTLIHSVNILSDKEQTLILIDMLQHAVERRQLQLNVCYMIHFKYTASLFRGILLKIMHRQHR